MPKKSFIENSFPVKEVSDASVREKNVRHGHISTLHIWWARRPLASSRATNFAALIDLPDELIQRKKIKNILINISSWDSVKNKNNENIKLAKQMLKEQWSGKHPKILDPFSGGGSIPLEALRLGCKTYANDYNPIAVLINKATLEWPQKFNIKIENPDKDIGIDGKKEKIDFLPYLIDKWTKFYMGKNSSLSKSKL